VVRSPLTELSKAEALANIAITERHWVVEAEISTEVWKNHGETIAPELSDNDWPLVARAFLAAEHIKCGRGLYLDDDLLRDQPISDQVAEQVSVMLQDIQRGREALVPYMKLSR
jgi:hypothetical protein